MDIIEAIKLRRSVRSYSGMPLSAVQVRELNDAIGSAFSPFGGKADIRLRCYDLKGEYKPSTYGVIRNACDYLLMAMGDDEESALTAGFKMEQVVLKATAMGLGTCWIAATFKGSDFDRDEEWGDGESLKIISPVGEAADKKSLLERVTSFALGSRKRKPFSELFFSDSFRKPLPENDTFGESLSMLRLAPSSTNSQPWRALVDGSVVHFYCRPKGDWSTVDCGIALCHFYLAEQSLGHNGQFFKLEDPIPSLQGWIYLRSYKR